MAQLALQYNQKGLDVSGQNATNARTPGYTRQRLDMMSMNLRGLSGFYMTGANPNIGFGVELTGVSQLRDKFLDIQYRDQNAKVATTEMINHIQDLITDVLDETDKEAVSAQISKIRSAISNYSTRVGENEHEEIVKAEFQSLLNLLHRNHTDLKKTRMDLQPSEDGQSTMSLEVKKCNELLQNIARITKQITMSRALGNPALEMLDQRNLMIDELSKHLPISVKYTDRVSPTEPGEKSAFVDYIKITLNDSDKDPSNDIVLLEEQQYNIKARQDGANIKLDNNGNIDIGDTLYFRQIGAEVIKTHTNNPAGEDMYGKTKLYVTGIENNAGEGGILNKGIFTLSSKDIPKVFDSTKTPDADVQLYDVSGVQDGYNANKTIVDGSIKGTLDMINKEGPFDGTKVNGIGFYEKSMDLLVDKMAKVFNSLNTPNKPANLDPTDYALFTAEVPKNKPLVLDSVLSSPITLKTGDKIPAGTVFNETITINGTTYNKGDTSVGDITLTGDVTLKEGTKLKKGASVNATVFTHSGPFTAENIRISERWRRSEIKMTPSKENQPGSKQNDNILAMLAAMEESRSYNWKRLDSGDVVTTLVGEAGGKPLFKGNMQEFYTNIGVTLGVDKRSTDTLRKAQNQVKDAISFNKDQVSGVDQNEETAAMLQYNQAYKAAARVMTAMDEMLDTLMNTGRVGR